MVGPRSLVALLAMLVALSAPAAAWAHDEGAPGGAEVDHRDTVAELDDVNIARAVAQADLADPAPPGIAQATLPTTWCGTSLTTDDLVNAATPVTAAQFKLVYVHAADRADRSAQWADLLQGNVSLIEKFLADQSGGRKAPRFDMGTSCGPQYVDVQVVHLPGTQASYADKFDAIVTAVDAQLNPAPGGKRDVVILADQLSPAGSGLYGLGELYEGSASSERPDAANIHNNGGLASAIFVADGRAVTAYPSGTTGFWPEGFLHEMSHNMGAVQWSAPHSSQPAGGSDYTYSHCWDGYDVMCYADGASPAHAMSFGCAKTSGAMPQLYDCGQDDYFNPAPPDGSYLATHWNLYNSAFLAPCDELAGACGTVAGPPQTTTAPTVSGTAKQGQTLSGARGTWSGAVTSYAQRWQRCLPDGTGCADVAGATALTYPLTAADLGTRIKLVVTATNADGSTDASSALTATVATLAPPAAAGAPVLSGTAQVGSALATSAGSWSPAAASYAYRWQRCAADGSGCADMAATESSYTAVAGDQGLRLRACVTASNADGQSAPSCSSPSAVVAGLPVPIATERPLVSGQVKVGRTLLATAGSWTGAAGAIALRWQREDTTAGTWADIAGATGPSYAVQSADAGRRLRAVARAGNTAGSADAASDPTAAVQTPKPPKARTAPRVAGAAVAGATLTADPGTWDEAPTLLETGWQRSAGEGWAWLGASGPSYLAGAADIGARLRVAVTAANADGTATALSDPTGAVLGGGSTTIDPDARKADPAKLERRLVLVTGSAKGKSLATVRFDATAIPTGTAVKARTGRPKVSAGRWRLRICAQPAGATKPVCRQRVVRMRRAGRLPVASLTVTVRSSDPIVPTLTLTRVDRRAPAASTARAGGERGLVLGA